MKRDDIIELHYIAPIGNVPSIMELGILSHSRAEKIGHQSIALNEIQERRMNRQIPGARRLHDYANLYFDAHNPMLIRVRDRNDEICVLRISPVVLDLPGVIISDRPAASDKVRFDPVDAGLSALDKNMIFARSWKHGDDLYEEWRHKSKKCAEVLIPDQVQPKYITGAYVANKNALERFQQLNILLTVCIKGDMFF